MKKLVFILLVLPFVMYAQSTNENYVVTKIYKKGTTSVISGNNKDEVMTNVQYFDGLGRLKQTVAVSAGGNVVSDNVLPIDWTIGNTGPTDFFTSGSETGNRIVNGSTPFGGTDLLWECMPDDASSFDGGWNTKYFKIDNTKTYRYSVWVKRTGSQDGLTHHGINEVDNLDGTPNVNPYFWFGDLPQLDTWFLLVGVVHPHTYRGADSGVSGVYDLNGNKVIDATEFRWKSDDNATRLRSYLYYAEDTNVRQYFWSPIFQKVDGGEFSIESIATQNSVEINHNNIKDVISHVEYDDLGRMSKEFLPITNGSGDANFRTGEMGTETQRYYANKYAKDFAGVTLPSQVNAYSEKAYDYSPLNRVTQQAAPGTDWKLGNGHEIKFDYDVNSTGEVKVYSVTTSFNNNTYTPTLVGGTASYGEGELSKTVTKDENWSESQTHDKDHTTEEFKNKSGQVILKRTYNLNQPHDTYYVYDDFGNLTYVIPPKAEGSVAKPTATQLSELCYQYVYDYRNRLVEKKIPGKGWEYIVYDKLDRPVLTQDALQAAKTVKEWLFTKYDELGRVVYTGYQTNSMNRVALQNAADTGPYTQYEVRTAMQNFGSTDIYYSRNAIPNSVTQVYTINYYDTYINLPTDFVAPKKVYSDTENVTTNTKGLPTVSKVKVLGKDSWITTITYYDEKARPIYVYSKNDYLQTVDVVESKLDDFTGKVLETKTTHTKTGKDPIITIDRFEYDHMDRLVSQNQQINDQISERIVKNNYDDLGQLESKIIGNGTKVGYQDVSYGINLSGSTIVKTGNYGWVFGLATQGTINGDGYVEFTATQFNKYSIVGFTDNNYDNSPNSINYGIYLHDNGKIRIKHGAEHSFPVEETYEKGDVFRVERIGSTVVYKRNNTTFYASNNASYGTIKGGLSMLHTGAEIKDFKIVDNSKGLQKVDYKYNVRGWLTNINDDIQVDNDLFNFSIQYNDPIVELNKRLYNGNIAQTSWQTQNVDISRRQYTYTYDALNRITHAGGLTNLYNAAYSYDKNGNILSLIRKGHVNADATSFGTMDDLAYTYDGGNKLLEVAENTGSKTYGFKDGTNTGNDYTYDVNGNMISDANKGITNIEYNHLNLPIKVTINGKNIDYTYDATGAKLQKEVENITTDYAGNHIYENGDLQFFNHAEGYTQPVIASGSTAISSFDYVYQYKDHLGNIRLSYTDVNGDGIITASTEIIEEKNYYPFGLQHKGYNNDYSGIGNSTAEKFGYNGVELEKALGLDLYEMDMRQYDATIARWTAIDPVTHHNFSTYSAFDNNPIFWADPSGADATTGSADWSGFELGEDREFYKNGGDKKKKKDEKKKSEENKSSVTGTLKGIAAGVIETIFDIGGGISLSHKITGYKVNSEDVIKDYGLEPTSDEKIYYFGGIILFAILEPGPAGEAKVIKSLAKADPKILKFAKETFESNEALRKSANALIEQLSKGNLNPGIGTKPIFKNVFESRARNGARVYFRSTDDAIEILGYSHKYNQTQVINQLKKLYKKS